MESNVNPRYFSVNNIILWLKDMIFVCIVGVSAWAMFTILSRNDVEWKVDHRFMHF